MINFEKSNKMDHYQVSQQEKEKTQSNCVSFLLL